VLALLLYRVLCGVFGLLIRMGVDDRDLEIAVLRHQLRVLGTVALAAGVASGTLVR